MANLQSLYDIKERLEHAAIAGTGLLGEDFRLSRAAESLAPLAKASPVFARISGELEELRTAPAEERGRRLLDALSLVDAVAYTQGMTGAEGALYPLSPGGGTYLPASYSQLYPLQEALTGTGSRRIAVIRTARETNPALFSDFRVLPALIDGLGENYAELADLRFDILKSMGPAVVPRLKEGFRPAGKRDMARRVSLIDTLAGAAENAFYLSQLPKARKPVKAALLYALRHDAANGPKLVSLCQTERGDHRTAAHWALARSEAPEALDYWRSMEDKDNVLDYMRLSQAETACTITAELFQETMEQLHSGIPLTQTLWERVNRLCLALEGKSGAAVCDCYRRAAALGTSLDRPMENGKPFEFLCIPYSTLFSRVSFSRIMPLMLNNAILLRPERDLMALAEELFRQYSGMWVVPYLTVLLLTKADISEKTVRQVLADAKEPEALHALFVQLYCVDGQYEFIHAMTAPAPISDTALPVYRPLAGPLAPVWFDLLMETGDDVCLRSLLNTRDKALCEKLGAYFYQRAVSGGTMPLTNYFDLLTACGWTVWTDLLPRWVRQKGELRYYTVMTILRELPISDKEKAAELRKLDQIARTHFARGTGGSHIRIDWPAALVKRQLESWEEGL